MLRLQTMLRTWKLDAVLLTSPSALRYVSGFSGSNGMVLLRRRSAHFYTDARYDEQAAAEVAHMPVHVARASSLLVLAAELGHLRALGTIGFEDRNVNVAQHANMRRLAAGARLRALGDRLDVLRMVKSVGEVAAIERAVAITDAVFGEVCRMLVPGVREREIAAEISYRHRLHGADGDSFDPIVLFGTRTSLVHGTPGDARLREGEAVLVDMGCRVGGYCSDMTRMCVAGGAARRLRRMHAALCEAQDAARELCVPGAHARTVDAAARAILTVHGLDALFTHSLGHGVGLDIHELPRLSPLYDGTLAEGHVVTIEPGAYDTGRLGARVEDMVVIEATGARTLTRTPRTLVEL